MDLVQRIIGKKVKKRSDFDAKQTFLKGKSIFYT